MEIQENIVNRVAKSGLITIKLSEYHRPEERVVYDVKYNLFQGLILREKEFREFVSGHDFSVYKDKYVAITCSADAIVPLWAYMLLASNMQPFAKRVVFGDAEELENSIWQDILNGMDLTPYRDQRIIIKGCTEVKIPVSAYVELTARLRPLAKSIMFGEPCSTVPVYKKK